MQQNLFQFFFKPQEAGAFGNNTEKEPQKPRPKLKKYVSYIFTENNCRQSNASGSFLQKCFNFVERLKFSLF